MIGILASRPDVASMHIARELLELEGIATDGRLDDRYHLEQAELVVVDELHLDLVAVQDRFETDPEWIAVVSKHAGETGQLLTAHFPGNIDVADFGGDAQTLPPACPNALRMYYEAISERAPPSFSVGLECTHHGPTDCTVPLMFVEIGSDEDQWRDQAAARAVAQSVLAIRDEPASTDAQLVGIGGGHYAPRFERILSKTDWAVGHIAPDWALEGLPAVEARSILQAMFEASEASYCLIDGAYPELETMVADLGYQVVSERWLRATSRLGIAVVQSLTEELGPFDDALELGELTVDDPAGYRTVSLPSSLLVECASIDLERTIEAVARISVAYTTSDDGAHPDGHLALPDDSSLSELIGELVTILRHKFDTVERSGDTLTVTRQSFDPEAAKERGVPEGPLFGKLAAGESITVDGQRIDPSEVTVDDRMTYELPSDV